ncbi:MAG TPA: DUF5696 domain-containing protein [Verrucomicrobiae bacterium]
MKSLRRALMLLTAAAWTLSAAAQPVITPDLPVLNLDELGVYEIGYAYRGEAEQLFPLGWSGFYEENTGVACEPYGTQNGESAFFLGVPWRNGTGITFQQFVFNLPAQATNIFLRGATAMQSGYAALSDGVTFRLYANGTKLFDYQQTNDVWLPFEYNFTALRGSNLTLRFEVDPGPDNNPAFDYSLWGDRQLVIEGYTPIAPSHPAPLPLVLSNLWSGQSLEVAPQSAFAGTNTQSLSNGVASFRYTGPDGVLEYQWNAPPLSNDWLFGDLALVAQMTGDAAVTVPLANSARISWTQTATAVSNSWEQDGSSITLVRAYNVGSSSATVRITGQLLSKTLALSVSADLPQVTAFDAGAWGPVVHRPQVIVPYYPGAAYYLSQEGLFVNSLLDWTASSASLQTGNQATYDALTDGTRVPLNERVLFTAGWHLDEVLPNPPSPPSPWRDFLANKIVLDIWGGTFPTIGTNLTLLADYGITNCVAIIHDWQRSGFDNALPSHYPANAAYGGDIAMSNLVATAASLGILCALHENYADYYPDYDFFDANDISLDSTGQQKLAYYNPTTQIQSFAEKPNAVLRLAATQSPVIQQRYNTRAGYIDVNSAEAPWLYVDDRAGEVGAGQLSRVWDIHRQLWAYERTTHNGPMFGEGNGHFYWSGCLDGVEAQFGSGWPGNGGFTAPLAVDFDLLKMHPLQFNHGMGYYNRWLPSASFQTNWLSGPVPMSVLDRYRLQEVAYGHAGFLDATVYSMIPIAWLEQHLVSPVTSLYATAKPVEISYESNGAWLDATAMAKLNPNNTNNYHVRILYDDGLTLTANGASSNWTTGSWTLPDLGWVAEGAGITAGTILRSNVVSDFADTGDTLFFSARSASDWNLSNYRHIYPTVSSFQQTGTRAFQAAYIWDVRDRLSRDYTVFVHFSTNGVIAAQQDHPASPATSQWQPNQTVNDGPWSLTLPANLPDGDYDWLIGLYDPNDGSRVALQGVDDGTSSIRLGTLHLANAGATVTFSPETNAPTADPTPLYEPHLNQSNVVVDFGALQTDGSVWLHREGNIWHLKTWPRERNFTLDLSLARFAQPVQVQCTGGGASQVLPTTTGSRWQLPLNGSSEYQWTAPTPTLSMTYSNAAVIVSWPASVVGYNLETSDNLAANATWNPVTNQPGTGDVFSIILSPARSHQFYRLRLH